ncbi:MAG: DUF4886 domain-containing protein [Muribaculaceae bacterium]|nr:DUF4886 domain-containing protein [Muribaculaceae bacterium]
MKKVFLSLTLALLITLPAAAKTIRILAVGNSFSRDAIEQNLHELAAADGDTAIIGNLFIGGCSLERHVNNVRENKADYVYRKIGADGKRVEYKNRSVLDALLDEPWDYVSMQQASPLSGKYDTYKDKLPELLSYIRKNSRKKVTPVLHQTWAYSQSSGHSGFKNYDRDQMKMYRAIVDANNKAARNNKIKVVVPCGTAVQNARTSFIGDNMNRDGYHLDLGVGRFTAACTWYEKLFGNDVTKNGYVPEGMNTDLAKVAKEAAHSAVASPSEVTDLGAIAPGAPLYKDSRVPVEIRVNDLLSRMNTNEKVMQLNQYTLGRNNNANNVGEEVKDIPAEIGSLIYFDTDPDLRNTMQRRALENSRLGIPVVFGYDAIHGFRTVYPISLAQACSWNPKLVREACAVSAQESRQSGVDWTFSPMIDVARDPRWGRVAEGYGEDPYANGVFGAASVRGYQGKNLADSVSIAACLKHYVAYGASEAGRDYVYTEVSPQTLWDTYLVPYEMCVKAGAQTLMSSFNDISGVPGSANYYTMTEILKNRWKHDGFIVSDWGAIEQLKNQGNASDKKDAAERAFNAGLEMDMMSHAYDRHLADLVAEGKVSEAQLDEAVRRVLRVKFRLGLFENPYTPVVSDRFLRPESREVASRLAGESMVLLKNDSTVTLPLSGVKKIVMIGPMAKNGKDMLGSWRGHGRAEDVVTLWDGVVKEFGKDAEIRYAEGSKLDGNDDSGFNEAVDAAKWADVVLLCLGENLSWSGENASRSSIALPEIQERLAEAVAAADKPIVLVLSNGRPLELNRLEPYANAILEIWQPGIEAGNAMAGILSGRINPSGKLAMTFPYSTGQIPIYYNRRKSGRHHQGFYQDITSDPMYKFGHGLSYTKFEYGDLSASATDFKRGDKIRVSVPVTNAGKVAGDEAVLWFIQDPYCSITRPERELKYFEKKHLEPGQTEVYTFEIDPIRDFGYVDADGHRFLETGEYRVLVGDKTITLNCVE